MATRGLSRLLTMNEAANPEAGNGTDNAAEGIKLPNDRLIAPPAKPGDAPIGDDGKPVELHHRGQNADSPLDEMTSTEHRGKGNFGKNHNNTGQEPSNIDRSGWSKLRRDYWAKEWDRGRFKGF